MSHVISSIFLLIEVDYYNTVFKCVLCFCKLSDLIWSISKSILDAHFASLNRYLIGVTSEISLISINHALRRLIDTVVVSNRLRLSTTSLIKRGPVCGLTSILDRIAFYLSRTLFLLMLFMLFKSIAIFLFLLLVY